MLGKVVESIVLHAEAADPDAIAPDKRKATGSYYTPRIVVHFICREVLPYTPDAGIKEDAIRIGYEISFTRHFYKPQPLRTLEEISADILAIEKEGDGLLGELLKGDAR